MLNLNFPPFCHISFSYITSFDIQIIHQRNHTTCLYVSHCYHCHYCNVDFVLFHNVTYYTNYLLSCIHVSTITLLDVTCTLVATSMILGKLESIGSLIACRKMCQSHEQEKTRKHGHGHSLFTSKRNTKMGSKELRTQRIQKPPIFHTCLNHSIQITLLRVVLKSIPLLTLQSLLILLFRNLLCWESMINIQSMLLETTTFLTSFLINN